MGRAEEGMLSPHTSKGLPMEVIPAQLGTGKNIICCGRHRYTGTLWYCKRGAYRGVRVYLPLRSKPQ